MPTRCERYGYQEHMPFARQPFKAIYVAQRIITTLLMVPFWILYYAILPRRYRPRKSWSLKQIVAVNFTRRIYKVAELAGVTWGTRNPNEPCDNRKLKETRFEWIDPLPENLRTGIVVDKQVEFKKVGVFIWPKECPADGLDINSSSSEAVLTNQPDVETSAGGIPLIGIFLHGGGYCHMSAHESSGTSKIPRQLMEVRNIRSAYVHRYYISLIVYIVGQGVYEDICSGVPSPPTCSIPCGSSRCCCGVRIHCASSPASTGQFDTQLKSLRTSRQYWGWFKQ
ncbi:hypothetical protein AcV5_003475 [Taiwanofungus camphoratus]|nr:hypothetical protein AcV5_003475 [Antrodia cinnamomea]